MSDTKELWVQLKGIDMEFEAWELIRLFFDAERIKFLHEDNFSEFTSGALMKVSVSEDAEKWWCETAFYPEIPSGHILMEALEGKMTPLYSSQKAVTQEALTKPGGQLLKSRKILAGACMEEVLFKICNKKLPYGALTGVRPVKLAMLCLKDGMNKEEAVKHLVTATGMTSEKAALLYDVAVSESPYVSPDENIVHLYVGIPFCASRCLYCSFTSYSIDRFRNLVPHYLTALEKEMAFAAQYIAENKLRIGSVYIGGGTPSSIDAKSIRQLLNGINRCFDLKGIEFTMEAGRPDALDREKLMAIFEGKVNRISINPQTMNAETLKLIGRNHTPGDVEEKFYLAREVGFRNINMDIIAGLPGEDEAMFRYTLRKIEEMSPESLTVHTMAVKRASRLREEEPAYSGTSDTVIESMIEEARLSALRMSMRPYYLYRQKNILANLENIGYARPGLECIYNINQMEEQQSVLALGAGAISKIIKNGKFERTCNVKEVTQYIARIDEMLERKGDVS